MDWNSIDAMIAVIVSFFVALVGLRVTLPIMLLIFGQTWNNQFALLGLKLGWFMIIFTVVFILVFGQLLNKRKQAEGEVQ